MRWMIADVPILADDAEADVMVILAHGAGSHMEHKTMEWLAGIVRAAGANVVRFNFRYRAQGRSMPDRMPALISTYRDVINSVRGRLGPKRLVIGGHSMGGRVASMLEAEGKSADGLLLFGYPLHPAGQTDKLRDTHLSSIETPTLQLSGTEDALCDRALMEQVASRLDSANWALHWIEGADHSYSVKKSTGRNRADVAQEMERAVKSFLGEITR